mgnify:CR=1 FL=1
MSSSPLPNQERDVVAGVASLTTMQASTAIARGRRLAAVALFATVVVGAGPSARTDRDSAARCTAPSARALSELLSFFEVAPVPGTEGFDFRVRCAGYGALVRSTGFVLSLDGAPLVVQLEGARTVAPDTAGLELAGRVHHLAGNDPSRWRTDVQIVRGARYAGVADGLSWELGLDAGRLSFAFVADGVEPALRLDGAAEVHVGADGALLLATPRGLAQFSAPRAWQPHAGTERSVAAAFVVEGPGRVRIALGPHDATRPVHVDPTVSYASYLGGSAADSCAGAAFDANGRAFVAGSTWSSGLPTTSGAYDTSIAEQDVYVAALAADGASLAWATFLGGGGQDLCLGLCVDASGRPVVGGTSASTDLPTTAGVVQRSRGSNASAGFFTKLRADGAALVWSTYWPLGTFDAFAVAPAGAVHVVAGPTIHTLAADGSAVSWSTTIGSYSLGTEWKAVAADDHGHVFVGGSTVSQISGVSGTFQTQFGGTRDALLARLDASGGVDWISYVGGSGSDRIAAVDVDAGGRVVMAGATASDDLPLTSDALQTARSASSDAFVGRASHDGATLLYATYLGGGLSDEAVAVRAHRSGTFCVAGRTQSTDFPVSGAFTTGGGVDFTFLAEFDHTNTRLWSTTYGSSSGTSPTAVGVGPDGSVLLVGATSATDLPLTNALIADAGGSGDGWFMGVPDTLPTDVRVPELAADVLPPWTVAVGYAEDAPLVGGRAPIVWQVTSGALPSGMTFGTDGHVSGTPSVVGTYTLGVHVVDAYGFVMDGTLGFTVNPTPALTSASPLAPWTVEVPVVLSVSGSGGTGQLAFQSIGAGLPPGLSVGADGTFTGAPQQAGNYTFLLGVHDATTAHSDRTYTMRVNAPPEIDPLTIADRTETTPLILRFTSRLGTGIHTWSVADGALPLATGALSATTAELDGTVGAAGDYSFTLRVTDGVGAVATRTFAAHVNPFPEIDTVSLPWAVAGRPYRARLAAHGGTPPFEWRGDSGVAAVGLTVDGATGALSGTPVSGADAELGVVYADGSGARPRATLTLRVADVLASDKGRPRASLAFPIASGSALRALELLAGTTLDMHVRGRFTKDAPPELRLVRGDGSELPLAALTRSRKRRVSAVGVPVAETGRYFVVVVPADDFEGTLELDVRVRPAARVRVDTAVGDELLDIPFAAPPGARVEVTVTPRRGSRASAEVVALLGPDGSDLSGGGSVTTRRRVLVFRSKVPLAGGDHLLRLRGVDGGAGDVRVDVRLRVPRRFLFELPGLAQGASGD